MADPIYGIHQSQPRDVFGYAKANARKVGLDAEMQMLSEYDGTLKPGTTQIVFDDTVALRTSFWTQLWDDLCSSSFSTDFYHIL